MSTTQIQPLGEIRADAVYSLTSFSHITGLGEKSVRRAARSGLKVRRQGRRSFILGRDFLEYLAGRGGQVQDDER